MELNHEKRRLTKPKSKFKLFKLTGNPYWHARYFSDEVGKELRHSTGYLQEKYSNPNIPFNDFDMMNID